MDNYQEGKSILIDEAVISAMRDKMAEVCFNPSNLTTKELDVIKEILDNASNSNKVDLTSEMTGSNGFRYGNDFNLKEELIFKEVSIDGYCYLWLILAIQEVNALHIHEFERAISKLKKLGKFPEGADIVELLVVLKLEMQGVVGFPDYRTFALTQAMDEIMHSGVRFNYSENGGLIHIMFGCWGSCNCSEILCEHGWKSNFIFTVISSSGRRVGGTTINLDDLFMDTQEEECENSTAPLKVNSGFKTINKTRRVDNLDVIRELEESISDLHIKNDEKADQLEHMYSSFKDMLKTVKDLKVAANNQPKEADEKTVFPDDSSSNIGRYEKSFMKPGTVISYNRSMGGVQEENVVSYTPRRVPDVVVGYMKTERMVKREEKSFNKVAPINGLCKPYTSSRLNFLAHLHTAMEMLADSEVGKSPLDIMKMSRKMSGKTPTMELLCQVVERTFDESDEIIVANPFSLPYLEIGMSISVDCVVKCFDLLGAEYEMLWFQEMKSLIIPRFHRKYRKLSTEGKSEAYEGTTSHSRQSRRSSSTAGSSVDVAESRERRRAYKKSGSILTLFS
jgi:hypothetical protein